MLEPTISLAKAKSFGGDRSAAGRYAAEQRWAGHRKKGDEAVLFDFYEPHFKYPDDFYKEVLAPQKFRELKAAMPEVSISDAPALAGVTQEALAELVNGPLMKITQTVRAGYHEYHTREYLIEYMVGRIWSMWTSDPNTKLARMVKDSVSRQFGISWREGVDDRHTKRYEEATGYGRVKGVSGLNLRVPADQLEIFDKIVKAMYEHTQARLAATGITHVRLFRGTAVPTADLGKGVYRSSPLAGWTIDKTIAEKWQGQAFGNESKTSVIMEAEVPVSQIFWAQGISTGKGNFIEEFEFLTLGGDVPLKSMRKREDWLLQKAKSFGGDRSAAGRYAAEQRWAGHTKKGDAKVVFNPYTPDPANEGNWFAEIYSPEEKKQGIPALPKVQISDMPAIADLTDADLRTLLQGRLSKMTRLGHQVDDGDREQVVTAIAIRLVDAWKMDPKNKLALLVKDSISRQMGIPWRKGEADRYATEHRGVGMDAGDVYQGVEGLRKIIGPEEIAIFDKIVMAIYQKTQARLAETGITHMRLFRGTAVPPEKFGKPYSSAPLSGWAPMKNTAGGFQGGGNLPNRYWWTPVLMEAEIPVEKIFWAQGWSGIPTNFHSNEEEVIVTGGKIPVQMWTKEQWDKRYDTMKARSFGGDRSAAGRYAANMRWAGHVRTETSADETTGVYDAYVKDEDKPDDFYAERYRTPFWDDIPIQRPPFTAMPAMEGVTVEDVESLTDGVFRDIVRIDAPEQEEGPEQLEKMVDFLAGIFWLRWKTDPSQRLPVLVKDSVARQMDSRWRRGDADVRALREPKDIEGIGTVYGVEGMRKLLPKKDLETFDKIVMAIYQRNQRVLESLGITHMRLFRGTAVPEDALDTKVYDSAPIAGWSINKEVARRWEGPESNDAEYSVEGTKPVVMEAIVPAKKIFWAENLTAFGTSYLGEREVAVIGPKVPLESIRTHKDYEMRKAKSFGGDRSAAGRYAAEQRWARHVKVAGFTDANGLLDANKLEGIKTRHPKWLELDATAKLDGNALYEVFTWFGGAVVPEWMPPNWRRDAEAAAKENPPRDIYTPEQKQIMLDEIYEKMVNSWKGTSRSNASRAVRDSLIRQGMGIWRNTKGDIQMRREIEKIRQPEKWVADLERSLIFSGEEQKVFDAIVLGIYQHTQRVLQEHGVKEVRAFRGTAIDGDDDVSPEQRNTYQAAALSSWSLNRATAQSFVGGDYRDASSVMYDAKIPAEQVFAIEGWTTDKSSNEREVFVIGGKKPLTVKTYGTSELSEDALKAKSFGGDRSAAGRYAANMRWAGHTKTETSADAGGGRLSGTVKDPKTTLFGPHHPQAVVMKKWIENNPRSSMPSAKALTDEELAWVTNWLGPEQYSELRLKEALADPELRADLIDRLTKTLLLVWKGSPRRPVSIIVKDSVARQFGAHWRVGENGSEDQKLLSGIMPEDDRGNFRLNALKEAYGFGTSDTDMAQSAVDKLVLSIYEQTQGAMEAAGFTELRAFRGTKNEGIRSEWNAAYTEPASVGRPNPIVVQTGYNGAPVSGWTFWRKVAGEFAESEKGVMLATTVPRDQVFAIEGFNIEASDYNEDEIWLIGNAFAVSAGVYEEDFSGPEFDAVQGTSDSAPIFVFSKASFGGDRSAAGRYAANMRWAGHNKRMDSIVERTIANEGLSVKMLTGEEPKTGFMVAKRGYTMIVRDEDFMDPAKGKAILKKYLKKYGKFLRGEQYLGLWWDKDNKEIVLDVVDQIADRDDAIKAGERENQQYIWDVENAESIYTGGTGDRETEAPDATGQVSKAGGGHDGRRIGRHGGHHLGTVYGGSGRDRELMRLIAKARLEARVRVLKNQPSSSAVHVDAIMQTRAPRKKKKKKKVRNRLLIGDE